MRGCERSGNENWGEWGRRKGKEWRGTERKERKWGEKVDKERGRGKGGWGKRK